MATVPIENQTNIPMHVAGRTIPPGEVRYFEESELPRHLRKPEEQPEPEPASDALAELLEGSVKDVEGAFGSLTTEDLTWLIELEEAGKNRKTLLSAVSEELLRRAEQSLEEKPMTGVARYIMEHGIDVA